MDNTCILISYQCSKTIDGSFSRRTLAGWSYISGIVYILTDSSTPSTADKATYVRSGNIFLGIQDLSIIVAVINDHLIVISVTSVICNGSSNKSTCQDSFVFRRITFGQDCAMVGAILQGRETTVARTGATQDSSYPITTCYTSFIDTAIDNRLSSVCNCAREVGTTNDSSNEICLTI